MKKLLLALALLFPTSAWAQCTGVFQPQTLCGNLGAAPAPPSMFSASGTVIGPGSSTINGLPLWANTFGTQLQDGNGKTVAGNYTWSGTQTYTGPNIFQNAVNFGSTFQINGNTITWPNAPMSVARIDSGQTFLGTNTFIGLVTIDGNVFTSGGGLQIGTPTGGDKGIGTINAQSVWINGVQVFTVGPTFQQLTAASGTYTTPAGVRWLHIRMVGAGGGAGGVGSSTGPNGVTGGNTVFGIALLQANGGIGGIGSTGAAAATGGAGGTASPGSAPGISTTGNPGGMGLSGGVNGIAGLGGASIFGGGGTATNQAAAGGSASTNSGSGGGSCVPVGSTTGGGGGGSGGGLDVFIINPNPTYTFSVGTGGAGGVGTGGILCTGGAGANGQIFVEEHYNN